MSDLLGDVIPVPERKWIPAVYCDEVCPAARATPQDWLISPFGDAYALAAAWRDDDGVTIVIAPGEAVSFMWLVELGSDTLTIKADGTWSTLRPEPDTPPGGSLSVWEMGDFETMMDSLSEFAAEQISCDPEAREVDICYCAWSREETLFVLRDGKLVPAEVDHG
jgi:Fe-S oxidoreductase